MCMADSCLCISFKWKSTVALGKLISSAEGVEKIAIVRFISTLGVTFNFLQLKLYNTNSSCRNSCRLTTIVRLACDAAWVARQLSQYSCTSYFDVYITSLCCRFPCWIVSAGHSCVGCSARQIHYCSIFTLSFTLELWQNTTFWVFRLIPFPFSWHGCRRQRRRREYYWRKRKC